MNRLVYIGNLGDGYDLETVIAAVVSDSELSLDIAGRGPKEEKLRELARQIPDRIRFYGYLEERDLQALLSRCEVGVIPMRDDSWVGMPYKLGDYLKAGLHVVSSLHGECGELLERKRLGVTYDFGSVSSLRSALKALSDLAGARVVLPKELDASRIYPAYVSAVS